MKSILRVTAMVVMSFYMVPAAAQEQNQSPEVSAARAEQKAAFKAVILKCEAQNNLTGKVRDLTDAQKKEVFQCVHAARKVAKTSCEQSTGVTPPEKGSGQKLSPEDRQKFHACMKEKGFGFRHHKHQAPVEATPSAS